MILNAVNSVPAQTEERTQPCPATHSVSPWYLAEHPLHSTAMHLQLTRHSEADASATQDALSACVRRLENTPCKVRFPFHRSKAPTAKMLAFNVGGVFLLLGYSSTDEALLRPHTNLGIQDAVRALQQYMIEHINNQVSDIISGKLIAAWRQIRKGKSHIFVHYSNFH